MFILRLIFILALCFALNSPASVVAADAPTHGETGHAGTDSKGLPMKWSGDLALFSLVTFGVYLLVLKAGAWGPLQAGLNERERGIQQNIADAETCRLKSEAMLKEHELKLAKVHEEVRDILAEARRDAEHAKQDIIATAQREADATKQRAIAEIERSRDLALSELFDYVSSNVINATENVIGRSLSGADHERLVGDALSQLNVRRNQGAV